MEDKELFKLCNPILVKRETHLLFLNVVINWLKYIGVDIEPNMCTKEGERMGCQKLSMFVPLRYLLSV